MTPHNENKGGDGRISNAKAGLKPEQTKSLTHTHDWQPSQTQVPLHNYVMENGKIVRDLIQGSDTLKQFKCNCGRVETFDLDRRVA